MIPQKTVQEILETAKVQEVVEDYVSLRRRGVNLIGLCPFHNEKTPSFTVSPAKNLFKCFGCGKGGDPARFLMEHENLSFPEALKQLAKKYRIEIEEVKMTPEMAAEQAERESLFIVNEFARSFFQDQLLNTDVGKSVGLSYFKARGFREETIKKFGLGFAPNDRDAFIKKATQIGYKPEYLQRLGLAKNGRDFFWNRVMFSIHNLTGKPIAFAGRILQKDVKAPKYINSPETEIYTKSKILYGAYFAKRDIRKQDECILVEGYTDVISLHQAGIENVVASSGTSLTEGQILLIKRFTPNIKILYDGDAAGIKAALRGLDLVLEKDMNVKVVLLPDGEDPDSYLQKVGATAFKDYIDKEAKDFILFKTDLLLSDVGGDPVKRAGLVHDIVDSIARVPDPFKRSFYVKECARIMELEEQVLISETNKVVKKILQKREFDRNRKRPGQVHIVPEDSPPPGEQPLPDTNVRPIQPAQKELSQDEFQERDIARLLIAFGGEIFDPEDEITVAEYILSNIEEVLEDFDNPQYQGIVKECLERVVAKQPLSPRYFIGHQNHELSALSIDLLHSPYEYSPGWEKRELYLHSQKMPDDNFSKDSISALLRFKLKKIMRLCEKNQQQLKGLNAKDDVQKMMRLLKVQAKLNEMRNELAKQLGTVVLK
ncbi:MAG TPA: DNA primase [Bacteroidetes bacterium]|nr:DNA primase [Bacteroidota bacterium]